VAVVVMTETLPEVLAALDFDVDLADELAAEAEAYLTDPTRTAHRLVTLPTARLVEEALGGRPTPAGTVEAPRLPGRAWRVLPDRLLALRPHRRVPVTVRQHLALTALVLESWGWAQTGTRGRSRTPGGRRCILGAQTVVHALGYGDDHTAFEAKRQIQGALINRGIHLSYDHWNEMPGVTATDALDLVREAARGVT
jgi:hypothetical protein